METQEFNRGTWRQYTNAAVHSKHTNLAYRRTSKLQSEAPSNQVVEFTARSCEDVTVSDDRYGVQKRVTLKQYPLVRESFSLDGFSILFCIEIPQKYENISFDLFFRPIDIEYLSHWVK
jgi:hypothetical protein